MNVGLPSINGRGRLNNESMDHSLTLSIPGWDSTAQKCIFTAQNGKIENNSLNMNQEINLKPRDRCLKFFLITQVNCLDEISCCANYL